MSLTTNLRLALQWRDAVAAGRLEEIAEMPGHGFKAYYSYAGSISQDELEHVCRAANRAYKARGSPLRIADSMGELLPALAAEA